MMTILDSPKMSQMKRLKNVAFNIEDDKSPRPDGMPSNFYKKFLDIVGSYITKVVKNFFHSLHLNFQWQLPN